MSLAEPRFSIAQQIELFKINYYKKSENMYNSENVLDGRIKKRYDFTGRSRFVATPLSFAGGVGSGVLPKANGGRYGDALVTSKRVYGRAEIEREAIKASANDAGAFVRATKETVQKTVESYMRNTSRIMFGDGSAILGRGDAATNVSGVGSEADPYVVTFGTFKEANFEEQDFVQVVTGMNAGDNLGGTAEGGDAETNLLEIVAVDIANKQVSLVGTSAVLAAQTGVSPFAATSGLCMQRSYLRDPQGLDGILQSSIAASGSLYNIPVQRRWSMKFDDASGAGITTDRMNGLMLNIEKQFGKVPNMIMASYEQYQNILALLEDQKVYNLPNRNIKGNMSFEGVEFMSTKGRIGIFVDRFCEADRIYFLNDNFIERHHRPDFGWFDDDGTVFLRTTDSDDYEARYGGYYENYITPTAHGCIYGLAV